jgi:hypothetical protein
MLFNKKPEFRRPPSSPYQDRSPVDRATKLFSWLGRGVLGVVTILLILISASAGPAVDLPMSKKGWFALAAVIGGGIVVCVVAVRWMHLPTAHLK